MMASFTDMFGSRSITQTTDGEDFLTYSSSDPDLSSPSSSNPATVNSPFSDTTSHEIMSESPDSGLWISLGILVSILFLVILYSAFHFSRRRHHRARGKQGDHRKASSNEGSDLTSASPGRDPQVELKMPTPRGPTPPLLLMSFDKSPK